MVSVYPLAGRAREGMGRRDRGWSGERGSFSVESPSTRGGVGCKDSV